MSERRTIKSYVIRGGRLNEGRKKALEDLYATYGLRFSREPINFHSLQPSSESAEKVFVEIGFGVGDAIIPLAERDPENLYIGVEVFAAGVATVLKCIHDRAIRNVRVIMHDAVEVAEHMLPDAGIDGFHIFFPDPWPKKKHHKRRLINKSFVSLVARKLKPGGYVFVVTDWDDYARQIFEICSVSEELHPAAAPFAGRPVTRYEKKAKAQNHTIHEFIYTKTR